MLEDVIVNNLDVVFCGTAKGKTSYEIAAIFGDVSRSAVMGKLHRLGLCETTKKSTRPITMPTYSFNKKQSTSIDEA